MKKVIYLLIVSLAIAFTACSKEKIDKVNPDDVTVNLNKAELQARIETLNYPVTLNKLKAGLPTPLPELWAIARILPAKRTYSVFHWTNNDGSVLRTTATDDAPLYTPAANPSNPSNTTPYYLVEDNFWGGGSVDHGTHEEIFEGESLSITGAGLLPGGTTPDYAYFTSHVRGDVFGGEIFAVRYDDNNGNDNSSALLAEVSIFDNTADYNDLTIDKTTSPYTLWVAGDNNARGAIIRNMPLWGPNGLNTILESPLDSPLDQKEYDQSAEVIGKSLTKYNMPLLGPSGNSVTIFNDQLWVVAGGTSYGGLVVMDKNDDSRLYTRTDVHHAKHFDMGEWNNGSGYYGAFLWGDGHFNNNKSNLRIFNTSIGPYAYTDYLAEDAVDPEYKYGDVTFEGKNAIDVHGNFVYMAMGADGIKKVSVTNGKIVDSYDLHEGQYPATYGGNGLANSLVVHGDFVYVAWGASGLLIFEKNDLAKGPVGQYNGIGSCNYVAVDDVNVLTNPNNKSTADPVPPPTDTILWAGFGTGGMIMLKFVNVVGN